MNTNVILFKVVSVNSALIKNFNNLKSNFILSISLKIKVILF